MSLREAVRNGIRFLNHKYGRNWRRSIDLNTLDLKKQCHCVLGQLEGNFDSGRRKFDLSIDRAKELGFFTDTPSNSNAWEKLTQTWKRELTR